MPSQRPFFLSTVFAAFRQQTATPSLATTTSQPGKQTTSSSYSTAATAATTAAAAAAARSVQQSASSSSPPPQQQQQQAPAAAGGPATPQASPAHSPVPIPCPGRRRGSDSSTEGFRNVRGADKWYIGGRTAAGEERFFKLGVMRRVRSNDRLSLDKLSL
ncbi:hypothetical protein RB595_006082 [Gaeumannomyces hyphopodioides]